MTSWGQAITQPAQPVQRPEVDDLVVQLLPLARSSARSGGGRLVVGCGSSVTVIAASSERYGTASRVAADHASVTESRRLVRAPSARGRRSSSIRRRSVTRLAVAARRARAGARRRLLGRARSRRIAAGVDASRRWRTQLGPSTSRRAPRCPERHPPHGVRAEAPPTWSPTCRAGPTAVVVDQRGTAELMARTTPATGRRASPAPLERGARGRIDRRRRDDGQATAAPCSRPEAAGSTLPGTAPARRRRRPGGRAGPVAATGAWELATTTAPTSCVAALRLAAGADRDSSGRGSAG